MTTPTEMDDAIFGLSDEELMALDPSTLAGGADPEALSSNQEEDGDDTDTNPAEDSEAEAGAAQAAADEDEGDEQEQEADPEAGDDEDIEDGEVPTPAGSTVGPDGGEPEKVRKVDTADKDKGKSKTQSEDKEIDYKAEYERLMAPFRANGKEMKLESIDDAVTLMQMGANYNKKMAALKPNLKLLKLLEQNSLLSEEKLSYLIDLDKRNPEAIQKLVKDSGLDPMEFDVEKESGYKPTPYTVDDRVLDLDAVLDEIQDTPSYSKTVNVVGNKWDGPSKQTIADNPQLLKVINDHVASGVYDLISNEVERERMLGRLTGLSDLEAYKQVGDALQAKGSFNHLGAQRSDRKTPAERKIVQPKPKAPDPKLNGRKRAAGSTPAAASKAPPSDFNPLALSDEEFAKHTNERFL